MKPMTRRQSLDRSILERLKGKRMDIETVRTQLKSLRLATAAWELDAVLGKALKPAKDFAASRAEAQFSTGISPL